MVGIAFLATEFASGYQRKFTYLTAMTDYQHQLDVMIANTLEKLQPLNPDRYALHYTELYTEQRNWNVAKLHQIEQDLIDYA
jgi:hypothetical protein